MSEKAYIAGLDVGTTGVKVIISDLLGTVSGTAYREYPCIFPQAGWMEQDVRHVWRKVCEATLEAITVSQIKPENVLSLGLSSQRGTFLPVDRSISPLMNSIVHSDMRAAKEVEWIKNEIGNLAYNTITGVTISGIWAYPKIKWIIDNDPRLFEKTYKILNGQEYFLHKLGAEDLSTDPASRTLDGLLDVNRLGWSEELCAKINLPLDKLPDIDTPARQVGTLSKQAAKETGLAAGMPIAVGAGDQQCAAVGAGIIREGMAVITIGTSMVMVAHLDSRRNDPRRKVLIGGSGIPGKWDMEGLFATAGSTLKWWRDVFCREEQRAAQALNIDVYDLITLEASKSPVGAKGFTFLPYLQGILTPEYYDFAVGSSIGMSLVHDKRDMARGILEGITLAVNLVVGAMEDVGGNEFQVLRLSGGGSKSDFWNRMQADVYGRPVETLDYEECTSIGAAILGAVGCGIYNSIEEAVDLIVKPGTKIYPDMKNHERYEEQCGIFFDTLSLLIKNNIFERLAKFKKKYY